MVKKVSSLSEKRKNLRKEASVKDDGSFDKPDMTVRPVDFNLNTGVHCSNEDLDPLKITIPAKDTLMVTGIPENLQLMLHKKSGQGGTGEPLSSRVFYSENDLDIAETVGANNRKAKLSPRSNCTVNSLVVPNGLGSPYHYQEHHIIPKLHTQVLQCSPPPPPVVSIPVAHAPVMSTLSVSAREHFKDHRIKSMGGLDTGSLLPEGVSTLKRMSSTGTPVLKRQSHVIVEPGLYPAPENLSIKRAREEHVQATNLSMKPLKKTESPEQKKMRTDRLTESLRYHQEILQNSPLIKRPGERNFSGFRHCYANTIGSNLKPEPLDTSYS